MYENNIVGYKMTLDFYEGGPRDGKKTEWKMHEYKILPTRKSNAADSMKVIPILNSYCTIFFFYVKWSFYSRLVHKLK